MNTLLGPILNPQPNGSAQYFPDGALQWDENGIITYIGDAAKLPPVSRDPKGSASQPQKSRGIILPPFLDAHIHIPQWPIRGKFCEGVIGNPPEGRLLAGLNRNVFPYEARCSNADHVATTVAHFQQDTLAHGVVGGAAYMTVHALATAIALRSLPALWSVGMVLMNMNCPENLRTDQPNLERAIESLAAEFGPRSIVTDRFAVAVDSPLRRRAVSLAEKLNLRLQTHLNEQLREKKFVEQTLYPDAQNYTDVYHRDGLLRPGSIMAHCIHMSETEFDQLAAARAMIAHCPTSNSLLGSGIMPLDRVIERSIPYAICTDVGASPTTSILNEMAQFLKVHAGRSKYATPSEALFRTTLAAAELLGLADQLGTFAPGRPASFIEVQTSTTAKNAHDAILHDLLEMEKVEFPESAALATGTLESGPELNAINEDSQQTAARLDQKVQRVTLNGRITWQRPTPI
jgi:guanine deaminase